MTRGKNFLKQLDSSLSPDKHNVLLFLLSKGTETLHTYLDSDFTVLAFVVDRKSDDIKNESSDECMIGKDGISDE
jgi:hypothetical protein